jgi:hypothetical protein
MWLRRWAIRSLRRMGHPLLMTRRRRRTRERSSATTTSTESGSRQTRTQTLRITTARRKSRRSLRRTWMLLRHRRGPRMI